ncbi:tripartite tricarboxylate transporter TctB family protein [Salinicola lusitanus]|uniref:Tripartite tricarboxylate transporter TctB family protein n=1 Tax=Salinicola lusitanus TaxID=1949085 RepID=A0ABZ3CWB6_9GAMM
MKTSEIVLLTGISIFAGVLLFNSLDMPFSSGMTFGPGFVPLIMAGALLLTIAMKVLRDLTSRASASAGAQTGMNDREDRVSHAEDAAAAQRASSPLHAGLGIVGLMGVMALAIASMSHIGVMAPLALLMVLVSWYFAGHSLIRSIGVTLLVMLAIYGVFALWLRIPLH